MTKSATGTLRRGAMGARGPTSSKAAPAGQGEPAVAGFARTFLTVRRAVGLALVLALSWAAGGAQAARDGDETPSGFPVPRYLTLKFDKVNARAGPGDDHRVLWVYRARGLPVQVIAETSEWRRICDPEGGVAWVHKRVTDGRRNLIRMDAGVAPLRRRPRAEAEITAYLNPRALAALDRCDEGWCRVKVDGMSGWVAESDVWGAAAPVQCR
ncbi:SH3 domain-containing protein [Phenylobacterium sp.]|uniref:SH3 domain-containing protein n=1 Tax=Phenylobacterium sp. TaxID=1871053 RepID=UPI00345B69F2